MTDIAIEVTGLTRTFDTRTALDAIDFNVRRGEIFGLLGPNGGGKSTLFRILSTLLPPTAGQAQVFGLNVVEYAHQVREKIGVVFQSPSLDKKLTVAENLRYQGALFGMSGRLLNNRIDELLARFRLSDRAADTVEGLSGGLARRVEVAKGMLHKPELLLLDEPSTGLDPGARRDLWNQLKDCQEVDGVTVLMTTHNMEEADGCDRLALLDLGRLVALGTASEFKAEIAGEVILIESDEPEQLCRDISERYRVTGTIIPAGIRLEQPDPYKFAQNVAADFGPRIHSLSVSKPTLEDVFLDKTGHSLWAEAGAAQ